MCQLQTKTIHSSGKAFPTCCVGLATSHVWPLTSKTIPLSRKHQDNIDEKPQVNVWPSWVMDPWCQHLLVANHHAMGRENKCCCSTKKTLVSYHRITRARHINSHLYLYTYSSDARLSEHPGLGLCGFLGKVEAPHEHQKLAGNCSLRKTLSITGAKQTLQRKLHWLPNLSIRLSVINCQVVPVLYMNTATMMGKREENKTDKVITKPTTECWMHSRTVFPSNWTNKHFIRVQVTYVYSHKRPLLLSTSRQTFPYGSNSEDFSCEPNHTKPTQSLAFPLILPLCL